MKFASFPKLFLAWHSDFLLGFPLYRSAMLETV
jgi:hypothetical protein